MFQLYKINQQLEDRIVQDKEIMDKNQEEIFLLQNKVAEREIMVHNLKTEIDKYYTNDISYCREIYTVEPDKVNLELYNELNYSRDFISKLSKLLNNEKVRGKQLQEKLTVII